MKCNTKRIESVGGQQICVIGKLKGEYWRWEGLRRQEHGKRIVDARQWKPNMNENATKKPTTLHVNLKKKMDEKNIKLK